MARAVKLTETMEVVTSQGVTTIINRSDFDPAKHSLPGAKKQPKGD